MPPIESRIRLIHGDITRTDADAVITAANEALRGGGGVDGAVHRAAGPELVAASRMLAPCPAGMARITDGFNLAAKYVIHAVGPIFHDLVTDSKTLASTYESSLTLAEEKDVKRIAFPCISTGIYGFPKNEACSIAIETVVAWLQNHASPEEVIFCCFEQQDFSLYRERLIEFGIDAKP